MDVAANGVHRLGVLVQLGLQSLDLPGAGALFKLLGCQLILQALDGCRQVGNALGLHRHSLVTVPDLLRQLLVRAAGPVQLACVLQRQLVALLYLQLQLPQLVTQLRLAVQQRCFTLHQGGLRLLQFQ